MPEITHLQITYNTTCNEVNTNVHLDTYTMDISEIHESIEQMNRDITEDVVDLCDDNEVFSGDEDEMRDRILAIVENYVNEFETKVEVHFSHEEQ